MSLAIRDRIKELRRVPASSLRPSPRNWRTHPQAQVDALKGVLAEVGYASATLARELSDGSLELIDGHARAEVSGDSIIPVLVLDVNEDEAAKLLATFDPLGDMAGADAAKLDELLKSLEVESPALQSMLDDLAKKNGLTAEEPAEEAAGEDAIPEQFQILVICENEHDQAELLQEFSAKGLNCRSLIS